MVEIKYQSGLTLQIEQSDKRHAELVRLDTVGNDGVVDAKDFGGDEAKLLDATCDIFFPSSPGVMRQQEKGFRGFVGLYGRIGRFGELVQKMKTKNTSWVGGELELNRDDWTEVKGQMTGGGPFTPQKISELTADTYRIIRKLEGLYNVTPSDEISDIPRGADCGHPGVVGLVYNSASIPPFLDLPVRHAVNAYLKGVNFLSWYEEIECDEWGWDSCDGTEIKIGRVEYLKRIEAGDESKDIAIRHCHAPPVVPS